MLIKVGKVTNVYIKVNGFMIRRFVGEAKAVDTFPLSYKFKFITYLITSIVNLITGRALYLINQKKEIKLM